MTHMVRSREFVPIPRFQNYFRLWVQTQEPSFHTLSARCYELGEEGLGVELSEAVAVGQVVRVAFSLPWSSCSWHIAAKVTNRNQGRYELLFLYNSPREREFIHAFLAYLNDVTEH